MVLAGCGGSGGSAAEEPVTVIVGDEQSFNTVVKPPVDGPVVVFQPDVIVTPTAVDRVPAPTWVGGFQVHADNTGKYRYRGALARER